MMEYKTIVTIAESEKATVELASMAGYDHPVVIKRLKEAKPDIYRLLCHAQNPHIPRIYEVEVRQTEILVAEEYVDGGNLEEYLEKQTLSDDAKLRLALQLCEAVEFLHTMEPPIIHRDIKPSNILITEKGILKLIDFDASRNYKEIQNNRDTRLLGTVEYAPPEQFGYAQTDVRSDIYSMGVVFHEMLLTEKKNRIAAWMKLVDTCTSFDPQNRFQSVAELKNEIIRLIEWKKEQKKTLAVRISLLLLAGFMIAVSLFSVHTVLQQTEQPVAQDEIQHMGQPVAQDELLDAGQPEQEILLLKEGRSDSAGKFYLEYPQHVTATLDSNISGRIKAIYAKYGAFVEEYPELERLQAWCYEIVDGGMSVRIKREYMCGLTTGRLELLAFCDDGSMYDLNIDILSGLPDGVPTDMETEEIMPIEIPESQSELYPDLETVPLFIWYNYYQSSGTALVIPDDMFIQYDELDHATCYCYQTGVSIDVPVDMLQLLSGYFVVEQQFMMSLEPYVYEFSFYYSSSIGYEKEAVKKTIKVHPEGTEASLSGFLLLKSEQKVDPLNTELITNVVRNGSKSKIIGCYIDDPEGKRHFGTVEASGRGCSMPAYVLLTDVQYGWQTLYIEFDTGEICEMTIKLENFTYDTMLQRMRNSLKTCLSYYKAVPEKPDLIVSINDPQPQLNRVMCFDYMTVQSWEVPADMTESVYGYSSVSGEYLHTLEPSIYRFTFEASGYTYEMNIQIYGENVAVPDMSTENRFYNADDMGTLGVAGVLRMELSCRITGVSVMIDGREIPLEPEDYVIACDGRYVRVPPGSLTKYLEEETITFVYHFDDGIQQQVTVQIM